MFRKMMLSGLAALGLATGIFGLGASTAEAREFGRWEERCTRFAVYYRTCGHHRWHFYGEFRSFHEARHAERHLEHHGFEAFVRECR